MMNGLVHHTHDKDENSVTLAMQRITLMGPRYTDRIWHLNTQILNVLYTLLSDRRTPGTCGDSEQMLQCFIETD